MKNADYSRGPTEARNTCSTKGRRSDVITPFRELVFQLLAKYRYLRTEHFYQLTDAQNDTRCRAVRRMLTLTRRAGYIRAQPLFDYRSHSRGGYPHVSLVYYLSDKGAHASGFAPVGVRSPASLAHDILVTEFHLALEKSVAGYPYLKLHWVGGRLKKNTNPDAIFGIEDLRKPREKSTFWFFVEIERSRQGHWRHGQDSGLIQKLVRYGRYRKSRDLERDWPYIGDFRVIVTVGSKLRAENLVGKLQRKLALAMIWVAPTDDVILGDMLTARYRAPSDAGPRTLAALFQ